MALFFTYLLPLLLPTAIYLLWRLISPRPPVSGPGGGADMTADEAGSTVATGSDELWRDTPWLWLAMAGAVLLAIVLLLGVFVPGSSPQVQYVPPRLENGRIVPGELRPADSGADRSGGAFTPSPAMPPSEAR